MEIAGAGERTTQETWGRVEGGDPREMKLEGTRGYTFEDVNGQI